MRQPERTTFEENVHTDHLARRNHPMTEANRLTAAADGLAAQKCFVAGLSFLARCNSISIVNFMAN